jgi:hypothetical protein
MPPSEVGSRARRGWLLATGGLIVVGVVIVAVGFRRPPQMGADERAFRTVDALYTAVRARNLARVMECEQRLRGHRESGRLPAAAADHLDAIVGDAKAERWQVAAERLYEFMTAQRRDGP